MLLFRDLGASCLGLRFRVLRFRNYLCWSSLSSVGAAFSCHFTVSFTHREELDSVSDCDFNILFVLVFEFDPYFLCSLRSCCRKFSTTCHKVNVMNLRIKVNSTTVALR